MGLDVYLYHCPDRKVAKAAEDKYEEQSEATWKKFGGYAKATEKQKKEIEKQNEQLAISLGCTGQYNCYHTVTKIEEDSKLYPENYFKIGYLRSSYNASGINSYLKQFDIPDLYEIFEPNNEYEFTPNWNKALNTVNESIKLYSEHLNSPAGGIRIMKIRANIFGTEKGPKNEKEALDIVKDELKRHMDQTSNPFGSGSGYSNAKGEFDFDGIKCVAFMMGTDSSFSSGPCCYIAYTENDRELTKLGEVENKLDRKEKDWYLQALEITRETIEYVLAQKDPQCYYLHWSG
jgi:hypothetical protein